MSVTAKPPISTLPAADSPGDVDGMLRAFFQAEMPDPWPATPALEVAPPRRPFSLVRSRWALAASVLCLLLGHAFLTRTFSDLSPTVPEPESGTLIGKHPHGPRKLPDLSKSADTPSLPRNSHR